MFSRLRPELFYENTSPDVVEHDEDHDAEEWVYDDRTVYRGSPDPRYTDLNVYSLYDESLNRIGIAEHERDDPSVFHALWFYDIPFATLLQEPEWTSTGKTLWSMLSPEAYQDLLESDFKTLPLVCGDRLVFPSYIAKGFASLYECTVCKTRSTSLETSCHTMKKVRIEHPIFVDDSYIMYSAPSTSRIWITLKEQQHDDDDSQQESAQVQEQASPQPPSLPETPQLPSPPLPPQHRPGTQMPQ
jgi:hypothetical protein